MVLVVIQDGKIQNTSEVRKFFDGLPDGKHLIQAKAHFHRSKSQNAHYWAICEMLTVPLEELGWGKMTKDDVHDFLKAQFLRVRIENEKEGKYYYKVRSTSDLKVDEFNDYLDKIKKMAAEIGFYIPDL